MRTEPLLAPPLPTRWGFAPVPRQSFAGLQPLEVTATRRGNRLSAKADGMKVDLELGADGEVRVRLAKSQDWRTLSRAERVSLFIALVRWWRDAPDSPKRERVQALLARTDVA
jgi:hypothetical protein